MNEPTVLVIEGAAFPRLTDFDFRHIGGQLAREFNASLPEPMRLQHPHDQPKELREAWEQVARRAFAEIAKKGGAVERTRNPPPHGLKGGL